MTGLIDRLFQGELGFLIVTVVALSLWSPAIALTALVTPRVVSFMERRHFTPPASKGIAALVAVCILGAYVPIYAAALFSFFDLIYLLHG